MPSPLYATPEPPTGSVPRRSSLRGVGGRRRDAEGPLTVGGESCLDGLCRRTSPTRLHVGVDRAPKGVMVEHAGLANLIEWHRGFRLDAGDPCTQIASPGFDAAIWEIWPCLAAGAALHVVPDELRRDPVGCGTGSSPKGSPSASCRRRWPKGSWASVAGGSGLRFL